MTHDEARNWVRDYASDYGMSQTEADAFWETAKEDVFHESDIDPTLEVASFEDIARFTMDRIHEQIVAPRAETARQEALYRQAQFGYEFDVDY